MLAITALILFAAALGLLAAELFVPPHGILAGCCIICAIIGVILAWQASDAFGILSTLAVVAGSPFAFYWAVKLYPNTPMGRRILLAKPKIPSTKGFESESSRAADLLGQTGTALTPLRPTGACEFQGRRIDCVAESTLIDAGQQIQVVRVIGLRVIVKKVPTSPELPTPQPSDPAAPSDNPTAPRWFYSQDGQTKGPISQTALADLFLRREIPPTILVWADHLPEWKPAQTLSEFQANAPNA